MSSIFSRDRIGWRQKIVNDMLTEMSMGVSNHTQVKIAKPLLISLGLIWKCKNIWSYLEVFFNIMLFDGKDTASTMFQGLGYRDLFFVIFFPNCPRILKFFLKFFPLSPIHNNYAHLFDNLILVWSDQGTKHFLLFNHLSFFVLGDFELLSCGSS
jgi:hypothetical protein